MSARRLLLLVSFIAFNLPALAHSAENPCSDWMRKKLSQTEMNICSAKDAEAERARLERLLQELRNNFKAGKDERQWKRLEGNQKDWEQWVRNDCQWESDFFEGGSIQPMVSSLCIANAAANRIDRLRIFLCEGAGMTGECDRSRAYSIENETPRR